MTTSSPLHTAMFDPKDHGKEPRTSFARSHPVLTELEPGVKIKRNPLWNRFHPTGVS
jgi:hypothetical protein